MKSFAGTWKLVKLALRLDRFKLPVWIVGIVGLVGASAAALGDLYGTYEAQLQYVSTAATSTVARAFGGIVNGVSLGSVAMVEIFAFTAVMMAFMSTLLVVRHTRKPEETGAAELIGSGRVGRYAGLTAAIIVAIAANVTVGLFMFLILSNVDGLSATGALGFSAALACIGIAFAGVAGIAAQLSETGRGANSIAGGVIGGAFVLRAIGDGFATVSADGLRATPAWPTWLSPFGWGFQIHPFAQQNWWLFILLIGFMLTTVIGSFLILRHRDVGLGIIPTRAGRARAKPSLLSTFGLTWRLQRGVLIGWSIGMLVFGLVIGGMAHEFADIIKASPETAEILAEIGGSDGTITDTFFGAMFGFAAIIASGYIIQSLLKVRSEEASGHLEALLSTKLSRGKWLASHALVTLIGQAWMLLITGVMSGVIFVSVSGAEWTEVWRLTVGIFNYLPALLAFSGGVIFLLGVLPRLATGVSWAAFIGSFLILQLAALLSLPDWVLNISPFTHIPSVPAQSIGLATFLLLCLVAAGLSMAGFLRFWRRDLTNTT
ncbi:MAG: anibiotic ABC transporter [Candidatus Saccharibacteria bacterium]|nr:anibiotic ABC transporter [Candidatus Saccharibacteria bacterium]